MNFSIQYSIYTSDNEPDGIDNATHNTFPKLTWMFVFKKHKNIVTCRVS
jgi:hypothetical protein